MNSGQRTFPVALRRCSTYNCTEIVSHIDEIMCSLGLSGTLSGQVVLLKPNLISHKSPPLGCTNGQFIRGVVKWFLDHGAKVKLGDSPAFGSVVKVCDQQGISQALHGMGVQLVEFRTPQRTNLPCGTGIVVARESLECDLFVGLPKLKAHNQMYVTFAVKNLFGLVVGTRKPLLHMVKGADHEQFSEIILDLETLLPRQVHLIDGIQAMHKAGPMDGDTLNLGLVGGALSPVALDTALLHSLELVPHKSPLWRVASKRNYSECEEEKIVYHFLTPEEFSGSGFRAPDGLNPVRFNPLRFIFSIAKRLFVPRKGEEGDLA